MGYTLYIKEDDIGLPFFISATPLHDIDDSTALAKLSNFYTEIYQFLNYDSQLWSVRDNMSDSDYVALFLSNLNSKRLPLIFVNISKGELNIKRHEDIASIYFSSYYFYSHLDLILNTLRQLLPNYWQLALTPDDFVILLRQYCNATDDEIIYNSQY